MNSIVITLLLVAGLVSGYFIGDYRGATSRHALEVAVATGKELNADLQQANDTLKADLGKINDQHQQQLDTLRKKHDADSAEWQKLKDGLNETIRAQNRRLTLLNGGLSELITKLSGATGAEKEKIERNIAELRQQIDDLLRELNGNQCLETRVPSSVIDILNSVHSAGGAK